MNEEKRFRNCMIDSCSTPIDITDDFMEISFPGRPILCPECYKIVYYKRRDEAVCVRCATKSFYYNERDAGIICHDCMEHSDNEGYFPK